MATVLIWLRLSHLDHISSSLRHLWCEWSLSFSDTFFPSCSFSPLCCLGLPFSLTSWWWKPTLRPRAPCLLSLWSDLLTQSHSFQDSRKSSVCISRVGLFGTPPSQILTCLLDMSTQVSNSPPQTQPISWPSLQCMSWTPNSPLIPAAFPNSGNINSIGPFLKT